MTATIGWIGTFLVIVSYAQPTARRLRRVSLVASVVLIAFNLLHGIWSNVVLEIALVLINIARLTRRRDDKTTDGAPTAHVLAEAIPPVYERQLG